MSKTLVYFASGGYKKEYETLNFDRVFLVDTVVRPCFQSDKVKSLRCDALEAVEYFKKEGIRIDCLVTLCESVGEGGQTYAICSDAFMGYVMPVLAKDFLWICNDRKYYPAMYYSTEGVRIRSHGMMESLYRMRTRYGYNYVSLDLPYNMRELYENDPEYLPPALFSRLLSDQNKGHVFRMSYSPSIEPLRLSEDVTIRLVWDSIWNHYDELDHLFISFKLGYPPMEGYFERSDRVSYYKQMEFGERLRWAKLNEFNHVGFTPHYWYQYDKNYQKQLEDFLRELNRPMIIDFYFLNSEFGNKHIRKAIKTLQRESNHTKSHQQHALV